MLKGIDFLLSPEAAPCAGAGWPRRRDRRGGSELPGLLLRPAGRPPHPLHAMDPRDRPTSASHAEVLEVASHAEGRTLELALLERHAFYAACRSATAVIATTDDRPFSCFLVSKGVV